MKTADFDFHLPPERVALRPARPRDAARMLVVPPAPAPFADATVRKLARFLAAGDLLVVNDTRVLPVQLDGIRRRDGAEAAVAVTLHTRLSDTRWRAFAKPGRKLAPGDEIDFRAASHGADAAEAQAAANARTPPARPEDASMLRARVEAKGEADVVLNFGQPQRGGGDVRPSGRAALPLDAFGAMPLPPYIAARRAADGFDRADYQTTYARYDGSVAAPTAGLHFTPDLLAALEAEGIGRVALTLHVGPGTFLPVKVDDVADHRMHAERGTIAKPAAEAINAARAAGHRIVAVGTTALRLIESAAGEDGIVAPFEGETDIFITPGYRFRAVDMLMTNFHLPRSTLFMLVAAFAGLERMRAAYAHAIDAGYRFYSYGDASLLTRADAP